MFLGWDTNKNTKTPSIKPDPTTGKFTATVSVNFGSTKTLYAIWTVDADTTKPVLKGVVDKTITVGDTFNPMDGVTATDDRDGDVTANVKVTGTVDTKTDGKYELTYEVSDKAGNKTTATRTITVQPPFTGSMPSTGVDASTEVIVAFVAMMSAAISIPLSRRIIRHQSQSSRNMH
ncbi:DUF5011 domain-containing protein [Bifidobacterium callitrichidarum]|uniref:DUF5011 domain-containing protein n=1 Tax=Bifidobacterium callitrichidarum TaxID=2052941 RepID=UPI0013049D14|nr:DUF5011 domain-containing protein [Bifidobacterium callitrichidarum]